MGKMITNEELRSDDARSGLGATGNGTGIGGQRPQVREQRDATQARGGVDRAPSTTGDQGARASGDGGAGARDAPSWRGGGDGQRFDDRARPVDGQRRRWRRTPQIACDVMTRGPKCARPADSLQQVAQLMVDEDTGIIPVVDGGRLMGVITDRDIVCRALAGGVDMKTAKASDVMTDEVECVTERDSLEDVLRVMGEHQIRRVAVVAKDDRLVGIISMADLAREADVDERLQDTFEEISSERGFWARMR